MATNPQPTPNHLHGSCTCARNQYTILLPASVRVFFDNSAASRRALAAPVTAWLRVPLPAYHSSTYASFPDETHSDIRKVFNHAVEREETRRVFCGFCGTPLTAWREGSGVQGSGSDEREWIDVTVDSLGQESLEKLEALGVLAEDDEEDEDENVSKDIERASSQQSLHRMHYRGLPYFETMIENSRLGRIKRQRGGDVSSDGQRRVEWEIVEIEGGDEEMAEDAVDAGNVSVKRVKLTDE